MLQFAKSGHEPLNNNEDNRIARFLITVLLREEITPGDFENWLLKLETRMHGRCWLEVSESPEESMIFFNLVTILRAVYLSIESGIKKLKASHLYEKSLLNTGELKQMLLSSLYRLDNGFNYAAI